jgi:predicted nucleotidyltransferase
MDTERNLPRTPVKFSARKKGQAHITFQGETVQAVEAVLPIEGIPEFLLRSRLWLRQTDGRYLRLFVPEFGGNNALESRKSRSRADPRCRTTACPGRRRGLSPRNRSPGLLRCACHIGTIGRGRRIVIDLLLRKREAIAAACAHYKVARLDAFGSALRHDFVPGASDIDLLVELAPMDPCARVEAYFGLLGELRALLEGEVDLVMVGAVKNQYLARTIERTKQPLYAA